jgi:hypothetical protein
MKLNVLKMRRTTIFLILLSVILSITFLTVHDLPDNEQVLTHQFSLSDTRDAVWEAVFSDDGYSRSTDLVQCINGDLVFAGLTNHTVGIGFDGLLARCNSLGNIEWMYTYDRGFNESIYSLTECRNGDFVLAGSTGSAMGNSQGWIIRTDAYGNTLWNMTYGSNDYDDVINAVVECEDGDIATTGYTTTASGDRELWIFRTNTTGHLNWSETVSASFDQEGQCIIECSTGNLLVGGYFEEEEGASGPSRHALLYQVNADGSLNCSQTFGGVNRSAFYSLFECDDGAFVAHGYTSFLEDWEQIYMIKTTVSLGMLWQKFYGDTESDYGFSLASCQDGGFALLCISQPWNKSLTGCDTILIRTDSEGNQKWNQTYGSTSISNGSAIVECRDGGYAVVGSKNEVQSDVWLFRVQPLQLVHSPSNQVIDFRDPFEYELMVATLGSGLNTTILNDSITFDFSNQNGNLTIVNKTSLDIGTYGLDIFINDTLGEFLHVGITISVEDLETSTTTGVSTGLFGLDLQTLLIIAGGLIVLIVIVAVKKRS